MKHSRHDKIRISILASQYDIRISILASQYDTHRDTLFRLKTISNCMWIILWWSMKVLTILQSLFEMVHWLFIVFVKVS